MAKKRMLDFVATIMYEEYNEEGKKYIRSRYLFSI